MTIEVRGGVPRTRIITVTTASYQFTPPNAPTKFLQLNNEGAGNIKVYWTGADATADINYFTLGANGTGTEFFEGPVELADENSSVWFRTEAGSSDLTIVSYQRRG